MRYKFHHESRKRLYNAVESQAAFDELIIIADVYLRGYNPQN